MCTVLLPPGGNTIAVKYIIPYHISYHILSCHVISYHISYRIVSYHIISYHIISYLSLKLLRTSNMKFTFSLYATRNKSDLNLGSQLPTLICSFMWRIIIWTLLFVSYLNFVTYSENLWAAFLRLFWWWDQRKFAVNCPLFLDQYRYYVPVPDIWASHQDEYD